MTITESLRSAVANSGKSVSELSRECGIPQPMLTRFLNGKDMRLQTADKLAEHFGLVLHKPRRPASGK